MAEQQKHEQIKLGAVMVDITTQDAAARRCLPDQFYQFPLLGRIFLGFQLIDAGRQGVALERLPHAGRRGVGHGNDTGGAEQHLQHGLQRRFSHLEFTGHKAMRPKIQCTAHHGAADPAEHQPGVQRAARPHEGVQPRQQFGRSRVRPLALWRGRQRRQGRAQRIDVFTMPAHLHAAPTDHQMVAAVQDQVAILAAPGATAADLLVRIPVAHAVTGMHQIFGRGFRGKAGNRFLIPHPGIAAFQPEAIASKGKNHLAAEVARARRA